MTHSNPIPSRSHARGRSQPRQGPLDVGDSGFEERQVGGRWLIRRHVSGLVPQRDLDIVLGDGTLLLESTSGHAPRIHQVFSVPTGLAVADVKVDYLDDVLTISMPLSADRPPTDGTWT
ncbi:hypothetical protein BH11ACT8_BH11ACT8_13610 [soil metagenome]